MPSTEPPIDPARREELLARIRVEVPRRRRRRRAWSALAGAGTALALLGGAVVLLDGGGEPTELGFASLTTSVGEAEGSGATTTEAAAPGGTGTTVPVTTVPATPPTAAATVTTAAAGGTEPCVQSVDPSCGPLVFSPAPAADQPLSLYVSLSPEGPYTEGQTITLSVTVTDPDAPVDPACIAVRAHGSVTTQPNFTSCAPADCPRPERTGTWAPPAPAGGSATVRTTFTARHESGDDQLAVVVFAASGQPPCEPFGLGMPPIDLEAPYGSFAADEVVVAWS